MMTFVVLDFNVRQNVLIFLSRYKKWMWNFYWIPVLKTKICTSFLYEIGDISQFSLLEFRNQQHKSNRFYIRAARYDVQYMLWHMHMTCKIGFKWEMKISRWWHKISLFLWISLCVPYGSPCRFVRVHAFGIILENNKNLTQSL